MLRQQREKKGEPALCLADYVAPEGDHVGAFAVTTGLGVAELVAEHYPTMPRERIARDTAATLRTLADKDLIVWVDEGPRGSAT